MFAFAAPIRGVRVSPKAGTQRYSTYRPISKFTNTQNNTITFPDQIVRLDLYKNLLPQVFAGTESLLPFVSAIKPTTKRPLIVTDKGLTKLGMPQDLASVFAKHDLEPVISDDSEPNPSCDDVVKIALAFVNNKCDSFIGTTKWNL